MQERAKVRIENGQFCLVTLKDGGNLQSIHYVFPIYKYGKLQKCLMLVI